MIARSALQFAVVREDPAVERAVVAELRPRRAVLVAGAGCTALALRSWFPELALELVDPNPAQLAHVDAKLAALRARAPMARFNVASDDPRGLSERGNFERLFRHFRGFLDLFVLARDERARRLVDPGARFDDVFAHAYWPVAFDVTFADSLLVTTFGPDAVQHAAPGSYPAYFRRRLEDALAADDRATNPYLAHLLLGCYSADPRGWPAFLRAPPADLSAFATHACGLAELPSFAPYDLVALSNVVDWMPPAACAALAERLARELRPGAAVLWRQLNDPRPLTELFDGAFAFDAERDRRLLTLERSFFYDRVHAGVRR